VDRILFVDDEHPFLDAIQRILHRKYDIHIAASAAEGLRQISQNEPFSVIVSDLSMPGTDGIEFLTEAGRRCPDSVRMLLTGRAQLESSIRAINESNIFRLLLKPCPPETLEKALSDGIRQYRLMQTRQELYALKKWNESLGGLIQAFVKLMESKDPYTAGHQLRVSTLSEAIAKSLGFAQVDVEQIRMAAMVHDIGKIYVPVEFLSKAGRLSACEWDVVKMHAQIGHDILAPVGFPFPIHEIVLQHHEKIDGSGYPQGLREDEIRIEAQIIAVADMLEAIAHHRPYRPARGMAKAMEELRTSRGTHYTDRIADAALALLSEGRFSWFPDEEMAL
jgi:putative two-component system response regulator